MDWYDCIDERDDENEFVREFGVYETRDEEIERDPIDSCTMNIYY